MINTKRALVLNCRISCLVCALAVALFSGVAEANTVAAVRPKRIFASRSADIIVRVEESGKSKLDCLVFGYDVANRRYLKNLEFSIASDLVPSLGVVNVRADRLFLVWDRYREPSGIVAQVYTLDGKNVRDIKLCDILTPEQFGIFLSDRKKITSDLMWLKSMILDLDGNALLETTVGAGKTLINRDVTIRPDGTVVGE